MKWVLLTATHLGFLGIGFAAGVYTLPILTAPSAPDQATLAAAASTATYSSEFKRDLEGSDFLHWGEGSVAISATQIAHTGALSPGPDYKVYLAPSFVETEAEFEAVKAQSVQVGDVKSFDGFLVDLPPEVDPSAYTTVVIWCEAFSEFITAAQYR